MSLFAQQPQKVRRIGVLSADNRPPKPGPAPVLDALRRRGWEVGKNLLVEARYAEGNTERLLKFAEELVRLDVELIVTPGNHASDAAWHATKTIPIVMGANMFPVERGLIASLARPGGNVTGTVWWMQPNDTGIKIFQILREAVPSATRSASFDDPSDPQSRFYDRPTHGRLLAAMGFTHTEIVIARPEDLTSALKQVVASKAEVLHVTAYKPILTRYREVSAFAIERKLVTISDAPTYLAAGGLITYGPDGAEVLDRTVSYVDRILRGAKPGDLPVEQATKHILALNAKTARAIGFKPPSSFMARVDRVVD